MSELQPNVDLLECDGKQIYVVGTAHVSRTSAELAEQVIREVQPDSVAVELCGSRYASLKDPEKWKNTDIITVLRSGKAYLLLGQLILGSFQKRIAKKLGMKPGEEMLRAVTTAEELGASVVLADREIAVTLRRTWGKLGIFSTLRIIAAMLAGLFVHDEVSEDDIERLKTADVLDEAIQELSGALPEVRTTLIDERDRYLAAKIQGAPGPKVVAIVGAGHVPGIRRYLGQPIDLGPLEQVPPPSWWVRAMKWVIPIAIIALIVVGFTKGAHGGWEMIRLWAVVTACAGGLGATLALAHPLTILTCVIAAPLKPLHPLIATGWLAGLVEAWLRRPRVADFETLADEVGTVSGFYRNRVSRVLLVMVTTNLTVALGSLLGGLAMMTRL